MRFWLLLTLASVLGAAQADEPADAGEPSPDTVLVSRGDAAITVRDFKAALMQIPDDYRLKAANDPKVADRLLSQLLENRLLAREARESGVAEDPTTRAAVQAATEKVLAQRQLAQVMEERGGADLEAMARDYYRAYPEEFQQPPLLTVRHVLVSTEERDDSTALERAIEVRGKAKGGADFEELVAQYSDDEGSRAEGGLYEAVPADKLVEPFARAASSLETGAISEPVKTTYGYHVIKLIEKQERGTKPFEAVRSELEARFAEEQRKRARETYLREIIKKHPLEINEKAIEALSGQFEPEQAGDPRD